MPEQIFRIIRALEAEQLTEIELKKILWRERKDTEWEVIENIEGTDIKQDKDDWHPLHFEAPDVEGERGEGEGND